MGVLIRKGDNQELRNRLIEGNQNNLELESIVEKKHLQARLDEIERHRQELELGIRLTEETRRLAQEEHERNMAELPQTLTESRDAYLEQIRGNKDSHRICEWLNQQSIDPSQTNDNLKKRARKF